MWIPCTDCKDDAVKEGLRWGEAEWEEERAPEWETRSQYSMGEVSPAAGALRLENMSALMYKPTNYIL